MVAMACRTNKELIDKRKSSRIEITLSIPKLYNNKIYIHMLILRIVKFYFNTKFEQINRISLYHELALVRQQQVMHAS